MYNPLRHILTVLSFGLLSLTATAQILSQDATVTLMTCTPGLPLYYHYGHSAIRVEDPAFQAPDGGVIPIDWTFNYGVFDFNQPGFYSKFVKGETDYMLWIEATNDFVYESAMAGRTVYYQPLRITQEEKQAIFTALMINFRPENRFYRYNFVYDNCATRPWHIISDVLQLENVEGASGLTWRQQIDYFSGKWTWGKFGINLCFGYEADQSMSRQQSLFLPSNLMALVSEAGLSDDEEIGPCEARNGNFWTSPELCLIILMVLLGILTFVEYHTGKRIWPADVVLMVVWALFGSILTYLYFFSAHPFVSTNMNVLWLNPLWFVPALLLCIPRTRKWMHHAPVFSWLLVWELIALCVLLIYHQALHPMLALVALHTWRLAFLNKKAQKQ